MSDTRSHSPMQTPPVPGPQDSDLFLGHPRGLFLLFLVEMWERFSYYGMRALLVLYLVAVLAPHELPAGRYSNIVEFAEIKQVDGRDEPAQSKGADGEDFRPAQHRVIELHIGSVPEAAAAPEPAPLGSPSLKVQRLRQAPDPADASGKKKIWVPDEAGTPAVVAAPVGKKLDSGQIAYRLTNPTQDSIKAIVNVKRDDRARSFFTVNDNTDVVAIMVEPDAKRAADKPADAVFAVNTYQSGRNWTEASASTLYGWYTGLAYLFPILGGLIADKLIGTHRSMLVGGVLISIGHVLLAISGMGSLAHNDMGMSLFITGLAVIVFGTGHFKPCVSVMVGQLYKPGDPRRDGAFTIFYMGINLGAFLCAFVCGTLGETVNWHAGFGSAAVGMLLGLGLYVWGKSRYLAGIGDAPRPGAGSKSMACMVAALALAAAVGVLFSAGAFDKVGELIAYLQKNSLLGWGVVAVLGGSVLTWATLFVLKNRPEDRGPVVSIFIFLLFNAFFWIAFEQAGTSINLFTKQNTDRMIGSFEVPATWFQSVNAGLIFILAPLFAGIWTKLGRRNMCPSQPAKIALGLLFLGGGYLFMVWGGVIATSPGVKASMLLVFMTYFWHTVGELCLSPTGLSYVTKAAPKQFVSLLMGIWFVSSFIANLGGGLIASLVKDIEGGKIKLWWNFGGQADFFFVFVVTSIGSGLAILIFTPALKKLMRNPND